MELRELSARSGVPVPTIKYYLREGLLTSGTDRPGTRADYDVAHLRRLGLIRLLVEVHRLPHLPEWDTVHLDQEPDQPEPAEVGLVVVGTHPGSVGARPEQTFTQVVLDRRDGHARPGGQLAQLHRWIVSLSLLR